MGMIVILLLHRQNLIIMCMYSVKGIGITPTCSLDFMATHLNDIMLNTVLRYILQELLWKSCSCDGMIMHTLITKSPLYHQGLLDLAHGTWFPKTRYCIGCNQHYRIANIFHARKFSWMLRFSQVCGKNFVVESSLDTV